MTGWLVSTVADRPQAVIGLAEVSGNEPTFGRRRIAVQVRDELGVMVKSKRQTQRVAEAMCN